MRTTTTVETRKTAAQTFSPSRGLVPPGRAALLQQADAVPASGDRSLYDALTEPGWGHDFSRIRVHPDTGVGEADRGLYTRARPIFGPSDGGGYAAPSRVQTKLTIGQPRDPYEQEADQVAERVMRIPGARVDSGPAGPVDGAQVGGQSLPRATRAFFEPRFGHDFSQVRVHADARAARLAQAMQARAFTQGRDVVFGAGQYAPGTPAGQRLLAHELTHVVQQGAARAQPGAAMSPLVSEHCSDRIQGSFLGDLWEGVKSVGRTVGGAIAGAAEWVGGALASAARWVGGALAGAAEWVGGRLGDAAMWGVNLLRDLPERLVRLGQAILDGLAGVVSFIPEAIQALASGGLRGFASWLWEKAKAGGAWVLRLISRVFDVLGGPELVEFITHIVTKATPLTSTEKTAAQSVLGPTAIRWDDVRVAEGGLLSLIFHLNEGRAFATFHTINLPSTGAHGRSNTAIVVHELTHVYQYERVGSLYLGQAIHAQATIGYGYGGAAGLNSDRAAGKHYRDYNREQQAQIAQDYYTLLSSGGATTDYDPFIAELRAGAL